jgi:hypothetical protein
MVLFPGSEGTTTLFRLHGVAQIDDFALRRPVDGWGLCEVHARERGWPNMKTSKSRRAA